MQFVLRFEPHVGVAEQAVERDDMRNMAVPFALLAGDVLHHFLHATD